MRARVLKFRRNQTPRGKYKTMVEYFTELKPGISVPRSLNDIQINVPKDLEKIKVNFKCQDGNTRIIEVKNPTWGYTENIALSRGEGPAIYLTNGILITEQEETDLSKELNGQAMVILLEAITEITFINK